MFRQYKVATVFGGTGFVGRQIVCELASKGVIVKVATRIPELVNNIKPCGDVGQIIPIACDYSNVESIASAVQGSQYVVNCIGSLYNRKKRGSFKKLHVDIPAMIARSCVERDVESFVHISALGCDKAKSKYAQTKLEGENAVLSNMPEATILRPSVIFGKGDRFFNMFAELSRYMPFMPLIGGGKTKLQPVYVRDVAQAALKCLLPPAIGQEFNPKGKIYELGGPEILSFREVYEKMFYYTNRSRPLIYTPWWLAKFQGAMLSLLPNPPITPDQVETLKCDSVVSEGSYTLEDLGIIAESMDLILPSYLEAYSPGGEFSRDEHKSAEYSNNPC